MKTNNRRAIGEVQKKEVMKNNDSIEEDLSIVQKNIGNAARNVVHRTKAQREK